MVLKNFNLETIFQTDIENNVEKNIESIVQNKFYPVLKFIQANHLNKIYVAFSGGVDSLLLLTLSYKFFTKEHKIQVIALHINHQLQEQANLWEEECKNFCAEQKIDFISQRVSVGQGNVEAKAREARYQAFSEICQEHPLLVAHHNDDNLEQLFLGLTRGKGSKSLYFKEYTFLKAYRLNVFRPFLEVAKTELLELAQANNLSFIQDPMNDDEKYTRVYWRKVLAKIATEQPLFQKGANASLKLLQNDVELLEEYLNKDLTACFYANYSALIDLDKLTEIANTPLKYLRLLRYWLDKFYNLSCNELQLQSIIKDVIQANINKKSYFYIKQHNQQYLIVKSSNIMSCIDNQELINVILNNQEIETQEYKISTQQEIDLTCDIKYKFKKSNFEKSYLCIELKQPLGKKLTRKPLYLEVGNDITEISVIKSAIGCPQELKEMQKKAFFWWQRYYSFKVCIAGKLYTLFDIINLQFKK